MPCNYNPMTGEIETLHERYTREEARDREMIADRYGACVNYCARAKTKSLELSTLENFKHEFEQLSIYETTAKLKVMQLENQRDELLAALCDLLDLYDGRQFEGLAIVANARSAIASVKGGA